MATDELEKYKEFLPKRFLVKIRLEDGPLPTQCWIWTASTKKDGYGWFSVKHKYIAPYKFAYQIIRGEVPIGLEFDHLCKKRACVNPFHVEPVSHQENIDRGKGPPQRQKTYCSKGHPFDSINTYFYMSGKYKMRGCLICRRERSAAFRARNKVNA
jgi:hypothetical protein